MKTRLGRRALLLALVLMGWGGALASAQVLVGWDYANITTNGGTIPPQEAIEAGVTATELTATSGGKRIYQGYQGTGWGSTAALSTTGVNYASFTLSADAGNEVTLTSLDYVLPSALSVTAGKNGVWAYRVDGGSWVASSSFTLHDGTQGVVNSDTLEEWDFATPIVTSGTVEFAFFSYGTVGFTGKQTKSDSTSQIDVITNVTGNDLFVNGSVAPQAVPEPSTWAFLCFGAGLFAWRLRHIGKATA